MHSKPISPSATISKPHLEMPPCPQTGAITSTSPFNCPPDCKTHFTQCHHLKTPFQLPRCSPNTFHPVPPPENPFSTALMPSKHGSPSGITLNALFNYPHALKPHFTRCHHLKPPFQLLPCPQNIFHLLPPPGTPFSTTSMPSKHLSRSATSLKPLFNCRHAVKIRCTQCQHLKLHFQLPPCPQNTFHPVPSPQRPFSTPRMLAKHILPSASTSNSLFTLPHALKPHFTHCHHLETPFSTAPMLRKHISPIAITSIPLFHLPPCPQYTFHPEPPPPTLFLTAPKLAKNISPTATTSKPTTQLPPRPEYTFHPVLPPQGSFSICPLARKRHFTQCHHLEHPFQLPPCSQNTFHPVSPPQTPFLTAAIPSKHISPSASTWKPLFNCLHARKTCFTHCHHLKTPFQMPHALETHSTSATTSTPPFQLPPCPPKTLHAMPPSETTL